MKKVIILAGFVVLLGHWSRGQLADSIAYPWLPEIRLMYGFIADHSFGMAYAIEKPVTAFQLNILRSRTNTKNWHSRFNQPLTGFGYYRADLGNPRVLGYVRALYGVVHFPLWRGSKLSSHFNFAIGLAHLSKKFDPKTNIYNLALGSHLNGYYNLSFDLSARVAKEYEVSYGFGATHYSNGRMATPNFGINILSFRVGVRLAPEIRYHNPLPVDSIQGRWEFFVLPSLGWREREYPGGIKYPVYTLSTGFGRLMGENQQLGLGLDYFFDASLGFMYERDQIYDYDVWSQSYGGFHIGYTILFDRLRVVMQQGFYLFSEYRQDGILYQRWGFNYALGKHLLANMSFKAYFAKAEFIEWGLGYRW